jgi:fused signal recognition particle receptor
MQETSWRDALERTRRTAFGRLASMLGATEITGEFWEDLEVLLIQADVGIESTGWLLDELRDVVRNEGMTKGGQLESHLQSLLAASLTVPSEDRPVVKPQVILLVGVNGSGKTTSAARLGKHRLDQGEQVLLATTDTYRAAAIEQLEVWGGRLGVDVIAGQPGSDPGAVMYTACQLALAREADVLIADTSGRMHTSHNLMAELEKVHRVAGKVIDSAPHEVLLVLDATTGQNGLAQARSFAQAVPVTGVILAKLDSSARGGVALAVTRELDLPIRFVGIGEDLDDLEPFEPESFSRALVARSEPAGQTRS